MSVVSVKVDKEIKDKMMKYKDRVNWAQEFRRFIEDRIKQLEADENFKRILEALEGASWSVPKGFSKMSVRENRDSS
ncbi:MAG: CopG family transcriptional regulator [Candidatus Brockarchaeota archaeon]|nr:CopG family transcriptional regulator [Candidatus Brockarchaeota archaeon]